MRLPPSAREVKKAIYSIRIRMVLAQYTVHTELPVRVQPKQCSSTGASERAGDLQLTQTGIAVRENSSRFAAYSLVVLRITGDTLDTLGTRVRERFHYYFQGYLS